MAVAKRLSLLYVLCLIASAVSAPSPSRIPKVYNALITSNQNLEPSKAYPVYQPVLHDSLGFPYPGLFYGGGLPFGGTLLPAADLPSKGQNSTPSSPSSPGEASEDSKSPSTESTPNLEKSDNDKDVPNIQPDAAKNTQASPLPPITQSPIPLNQFGLPPQVLPLGRFNPAYNGFTQIGPYYSYPGFRFYDPFDPFSLNYPGPPFLYSPLGNGIGQSIPGREGSSDNSASAPAPENNVNPTAKSSYPKENYPQSSLPEPNDLGVLSITSKNVIPNVSSTPLPRGSLKINDS